MKKIITSVLTFSMLICYMPTINTNKVTAHQIDGKQQYLSYIHKEKSLHTTPEVNAEETQIQELYNTSLKTLLESDTTKKSTEVVLDEKKYGDSVYMPDNYAGSYIEEDGTVIVLLSKKDNDYNNLKKEVEQLDDNVKVKTVNHNFEELASTKDKFDSIIMALSEKNSNGTISTEELEVYTNIVSCAITIEKNKLTLTLENIEKNSIDLFKKYFFDSPLIEYVKGEAVMDDSSKTPLQPGRAIYNLSKDKKLVNRCSIGYPAVKYDSTGKKVYGFITCAHSKNKNDNIYLDKACSIKIGKVTQWQYSKNVDAAFVKITNNNFTTSRKVYYSDSKGSTKKGITIAGQSWYYDKDPAIKNYNPAKGEKTWKAGSTTYLTTAKIQHTWTTVTITQDDGSKVTFTDLYATTLQTKGGDSGGVFFQQDDAKYYSVMGIVKGSNKKYSYFVRIENIQKAFNLYILGYDLEHGRNIK